MSIVVGDHERGENETKFVILFDNIQNGGVLHIYNGKELTSLSVSINPCEGPHRELVLVPYNCDNGKLMIDGNVVATVKFDHRDRLSKVFIVSCDHIEADTRHSLWGNIGQEIDNCSLSYGRTLVLHLGDNVYADHAFNDGLAGKDALESYRRRYRKTWFGSSKRRDVYSKSCHLMILDDHEVKNDFMISQLTDVEKPIADIALSCYHDYQESLHININPSIGRGWYRVYDRDIVITFERTDGIPPINLLKETIKGIMAEHNPIGIILGTSWAPLPAPEGNLKARLYGGIFGHHKFMSKEVLTEFYSYLLELVSSGIHVVVIGGDIHFGVHAIVSNGSFSFDVAAASAISNHPTIDRRLAAGGFREPIDMGSGIILTPVTSEGNRCYGKLHIDYNGPKRYNLELVYSNNWMPKNFISYTSSVAKMVPNVNKN